MSDSGNSPNWERQVLEKVALSAIHEQRRARRWGIFFKLLGFSYLIIVLLLAMGWINRGEMTAISGKHTSLVELRGVIAADETSADKIITGLQLAFKDKKDRKSVV